MHNAKPMLHGIAAHPHYPHREAEGDEMSAYLEKLKAKLAARENAPGKEYQKNCEELRREIARLEGKTS